MPAATVLFMAVPPSCDAPKFVSIYTLFTVESITWPSEGPPTFVFVASRSTLWLVEENSGVCSEGGESEEPPIAEDGGAP